MASFDYAEMADLAQELLDEFGGAGTLHRKGAAPALAADGSVTPSVTDEPITVVQISGQTLSGLQNADNSDNIRGFKASHVFAALAVEPPIGSTFTFDGHTLSIKDVKTVRPNGVTLLHFINAGRP